MKSKRAILEAPAMPIGVNEEAPLQLFVSYAHENEEQLRPFLAHLTHLSQQGYIKVWNDRDLFAGGSWRKGLLEALNRAEIVLLFYTTQARVSDFIQRIELPISLDRSDANECTLIWVPVERNDLDEKHPLERRLKELQCATRNERPIYEFEFVQRGWLEVEQAIRQAVEERRALGR